jgi:RES domain-containing protein
VALNQGVPPTRAVHWDAASRIVSTRHPPVDLYELTTSPEEFAAMHELEMLTNPRVQDALGNLSLVPPAERVLGPGASWIMAPFTHLSPEGGRFSDRTFGAYYAARESATAIAETTYHRARWLAQSSAPATEMRMLEIAADVRAPMHDLLEDPGPFAPALHPASYVASQELARTLRGEHRSWGISYPSVRHAGGGCVAVLRPQAVSNARRRRMLRYLWDGERITVRLS